MGAAFKDARVAMEALGFACSAGRQPLPDANGAVREAEPHLACERETREWLICTRRTRAVLIQLNGRVSNVLVNVGRFCM